MLLNCNRICRWQTGQQRRLKLQAGCTAAWQYHAEQVMIHAHDRRHLRGV